MEDLHADDAAGALRPKGASASGHAQTSVPHPATLHQQKVLPAAALSCTFFLDVPASWQADSLASSAWPVKHTHTDLTELYC